MPCLRPRERRTKKAKVHRRQTRAERCLQFVGLETTCCGSPVAFGIPETPHTVRIWQTSCASSLVSATQGRRKVNWNCQYPFPELSDDKHHVRIFDRQTNCSAPTCGTINECAIFILDPAGNLVNWNTGAARIGAHRPVKIIGPALLTAFSSRRRK